MRRALAACEGGDVAATAFASVRQGVAHEVNATALPSGIQHLSDGGLNAFVGIRDHQLDATQAAAGQLAQECRPKRLGLGGADIHAENLAPAIAIALLTPTATITATMRPFCRTFM